MADKRHKRRRNRRKAKRNSGGFKKVLGIIGIVVVVLVAAYLVGGFYYKDRFNPGTKLNGANVSGKTVAQAEEIIQKDIDEFVLRITDRSSKVEELKAKDISLTYVSDGSVEAIAKAQNSFMWIRSLLVGESERTEYKLQYDEDSLKNVISTFSCMNTDKEIEPVNAYPEYKDGQFVIIPEEYGSKVDTLKFNNAIETKLESMNDTLNMEEEKCYVAPKYTSESTEVKTACDKMNTYLSSAITYDMPEDDKLEVSKDDLSKMITYDKNMNAKVKKSLVKKYVEELKDKYDTAGKEIKFKTASGKSIKVSGGDFGWEIDLEKESSQLMNDIKNAKSVERKPEYSKEGEIGDTYAEVDLTEQHMYFTKNGKVVIDTPVVTGNVSQNNGTPAGLFTVTYKARNVVLRGPKQANGQYKWESPVSYWMPFNGGIGFHDANWRSNFGGTIYKSNGSHGCVNMPPSKAAELYEVIEAGMPVIVYK